MSLIITNLSDQVTVTVPDGGFALLHIQAGGVAGGTAYSRGILIVSDTADWLDKYTITLSGGSIVNNQRSLATSLIVTGDFTANLLQDFNMGPSDFYPIGNGTYPAVSGDGVYYFRHVTPAGLLTLSGLAPGLYYLSVVFSQLDALNKCGLVMRVLPAFNLPLYPALDWMPDNLIDLQADLSMRTVNSNVLSHREGLKQGDDFKLAVVPVLAGDLIISGITAMSLTLIDRVHSTYEPLEFIATGTPPSLTEIDSDPAQQYYTISGNLRDAKIGSWFQELNKRIDALAVANPGGTPPDRARLEALAQLHITTADGITTTQNFPFPVLASGEVLSTIGAASSTADPGVDLVWDFATNNVIAQASGEVSVTPPAPGTPLLYVKEDDDLVARLRLVKNGSVLAPTVTACKLILKELAPENEIVVSDEFDSEGSGDSFSVLVHAKFDGAKLAAALSNYEADGGTTFSALAEIELTYENPFGVGPETLVRTSKTFRVQIDRDLGDAA